MKQLEKMLEDSLEFESAQAQQTSQQQRLKDRKGSTHMMRAGLGFSSDKDPFRQKGTKLQGSNEIQKKGGNNEQAQQAQLARLRQLGGSIHKTLI